MSQRSCPLLLLSIALALSAGALVAQAPAPGGGREHLDLATDLLKRGRTEEAVAEARRSLALEPAGPVAKKARVLVCHHRQGGPPAAAPSSSAGSTEPDGEALTVGGGVSRPEILFRVNPRYPPELRSSQAPGSVQVEVTIDTEGCVAAARVLPGADPAFGRAASEAMRQWVFQPATFKDRPVKVHYTLWASFES